MIGAQELQNYVMRLLERVGLLERQRHTHLLEPLTSTSWDGDTYSTTARTLLDLSAVFGVPAGVRAVDVRIACKDSASAANANLYVLVSPNTTAGSAPVVARPSGLPNSYWADKCESCPCNADGDIYVEIGASGANTMTVKIEIWGWEW